MEASSRTWWVVVAIFMSLALCGSIYVFGLHDHCQLCSAQNLWRAFTRWFASYAETLGMWTGALVTGGWLFRHRRVRLFLVWRDQVSAFRENAVGALRVERLSVAARVSSLSRTLSDTLVLRQVGGRVQINEDVVISDSEGDVMHAANGSRLTPGVVLYLDEVALHVVNGKGVARLRDGDATMPPMSHVQRSARWCVPVLVGASTTLRLIVTMSLVAFTATILTRLVSPRFSAALSSFFFCVATTAFALSVFASVAGGISDFVRTSVRVGRVKELAPRG